MGIVRLSGRDAGRFSSDARARTGQAGSSEACGAERRRLVERVRAVSSVAEEGARHSAADRTSVRGDPTPEEEPASGGIQRARRALEDRGDVHPPLAADGTA